MIIQTKSKKKWHTISKYMSITFSTGLSKTSFGISFTIRQEGIFQSSSPSTSWSPFSGSIIRSNQKYRISIAWSPIRMIMNIQTGNISCKRYLSSGCITCHLVIFLTLILDFLVLENVVMITSLPLFMFNITVSGFSIKSMFLWRGHLLTLVEPSIPKLQQKTSTETLKGAVGLKRTGMVWYGMVCRRLPELKVPRLYFFSFCTSSSSEGPTPFKTST